MIAAGDGSEQTASLVIFMFLSTKCDSDIFFSCFYGKMYNIEIVEIAQQWSNP